jgi:hypothetical protein
MEAWLAAAPAVVGGTTYNRDYFGGTAEGDQRPMLKNHSGHIPGPSVPGSRTRTGTTSTTLVGSTFVTDRSVLLVERLHVDHCHVASAVCLPA